MNYPEKAAELHALVARARGEYCRLVWIAGGSSQERTTVLQGLAEAEAGAYVDLGKKLSASLLDVSPPLRAASVQACFDGSLPGSDSGVTCLDHLEVLFEPSLKTNPVALIRNASRHTVLVAAWPGTFESGHLLFGAPDHPAHADIAEADLESTVFHI